MPAGIATICSMGVTIRQEIETRTGRDIVIGALYTSLARLERKGYVQSMMSDPTPQRGGRSKRHFLVSAAGAEWYWSQVRHSLSGNIRRRFTESLSRPSLFGGSMRDVRDALRTLRAAPSFTVVALMVLAFGIGASTLIFSMVDAVVLRALPFDEPDRIVAVGSLYNGHPGLETAATFLDWRERQTAFEALTAIDDGALTVNADTQAEEVHLERVTAEFFSVLRVHPRIGHPFTADNEMDGRDRVAIISDGL